MLIASKAMAPQLQQDSRLRLTAVFAAIVAVALALLVGCGDDNNSNADAPDSGGSAAATAEGAGGDTGGGGDTGDGGDTAGGADSNAPALSEEPISKDAFVKQANQICKATVGAVIAKVGPAIEKAQKNPDADQRAIEADLLRTVMAPELRGEVEEIGVLGTPSGASSQIEQFLAAVLSVADEIEDDPEAFAQANATFFAKSTRLADSYGLESCPYG